MNTMFKTTTAFSLGMHAVAHLAHRYPQWVTLHTIAGLCESSEAHLAKVMRNLARNGIVITERGPTGGIRLNGTPGSISLIRIWNAIERQSAEVACPFTIPSCKKGRCSLSRIFSDYNRKMEKILEKTTLADLGDMCGLKKTGKTNS